jgi:multidrug resistance efflux pump
MKHYFPTLLLIFILASCSNNAVKDKAVSENARQVLASNYIVGIGKITPENDIIQLSSPVNGIVHAIYKRENDNVSAGTPILELDHQLEDATISLMNQEVTTREAQVKVEAANVSDYMAKINNAKSELQHLQNLLLKGAETQQRVDDAVSNLKSLNANLNRLQAAVAVSKSQVQETKANLKTAQLQRDQKIIRSPVKGTILELTALIGGSVSTLQSFGQIGPEGKTIAICEIDESTAQKISVGQNGWIRNVGSSDTLSTGTVYFASAFLKKKSLFTDQSGEKEDRRVRTIKLLLNNPEKLLLNARVECVIDISDHLKK